MTKVYPKEIFSSIRAYKDGKFKTLSLEALFARDNKIAPLIPPGYSVLRISIFGNDGGVNGNIKESEIDAVYAASIACINAYFSGEKDSNDKQVPFFAGKHKGKTPAQVILETGDLQILRSEKAFLSENVDRFPRNKEVIDSINAAARAFKNGTLKDTSPQTTIYHSELRPVGKEDASGMKKVYGVHITSFEGKFQIAINNCKAPVDVTDNGTFRVRSSEAIEKKTLSFDLEWHEWLSLISKCKKTADNFDHFMFGKAWSDAERLEKEINSNNV